jgi:DNA-binding NtrC family response regulator
LLFFGGFVTVILRVVLSLNNTQVQKRLCELITQSDVIVEPIRGKSLFWKHISRESGDLIILSRSFLEGAAPQRIKLLRELPESPWIIIMSDREDPEESATLLAAGCEAVLHENLPNDRIRDALVEILKKRGKRMEKEFTTRRVLALPRLSDFVSRSPSMQTFMSVVSRVARSDVSLLILGETGVGKERLARAIHAESARSEGPFIAVNCGALPETLLESELFGHEEGAFTGATRSRRGWFELAHRGTIFLDEIGELPLHLQVKLLRFLQEHEIQRIGSEKSIHVNVRIMTATNHDLADDVEARSFRKDLYYRLNVVTLTLPPLRERREDISTLVESYINFFTSSIPCPITGITERALDALVNYSWPGNVRELINVIEHAVLLSESEEISLKDLPSDIRKEQAAPIDTVSDFTFQQIKNSFPDEWLRQPISEGRKKVVEEFECAYLARLLQLTRGRIGETARRAGIQPRSLYDKMKQYGLRKEDFKI